MFSYGPPHIADQKQGDQLEPTYSSFVRIRDVALRTSKKRWTIGMSGARGSGISLLVARQDAKLLLWNRNKYLKLNIISCKYLKLKPVQLNFLRSEYLISYNCVQKQKLLKNNYTKNLDINVQWTQFPNIWAENKPWQVEISL